VRRFAAFANETPWQSTASDVEEWTSELLAGGGHAQATIRGYQGAISCFCGYLVDARYGWAAECEARFGTHPVQICHEWNTAVHAADYEGRPGRRPFSRVELQDLFDFADARVAVVREGGRKGWLAAFRDATLFKVTYAWGLRRREAAMLDIVDFTTNPAAPRAGPIRDAGGPPRQGRARQPAAAAAGGHAHAVGGGGRRGISQRGPPPLRAGWSPGDVADRTR
jgi:integrase